MVEKNQTGFEAYWRDPINSSCPDGRGGRLFSPVQLLFLLRLARLLRQRQEFFNILPDDHLHIRLLKKAIYSTYCDCQEQGLEGDAKALFERDKTTNKF